MPLELPALPAEELIRLTYKETRVEQTARDIILSVGEAESEPVRYTHDLWYSKAKTMLPTMAVSSLGLDLEKVHIVSAAVDVLWTLSVVVDDIYDVDETRRGKPAAWKIYGKRETYMSAESVLKQVLIRIAQDISPAAAKRCKASIDEGMASIQQHKHLGFENTQSEFEANYRSRDAFFSSSPMEILATIYPDKAKILARAGNGLETYYLGGQIGNDLDDLFGGAGRLKRFSDIRSGLVTLPVKLMWDEMRQEDKAIFMSLFGKGELLQAEELQIDHLLAKYQVFEKSLDLIEAKYMEAKTALGDVFSKTDQDVFENLCEQQLRKFRGYN